MELKRFSLKEKLSSDPASTILIVGSRRTGKTFYGVYLVNAIKPLYSLIIVFTHSKINKEWDRVVEDEMIFGHYDPDIIKLIVKRNKMIIKKCPDINPNVLIIFDDVLDDKSLKTDKMLEMLFTRGRHLHIGVIFSTQYLNAVSKTVRVNTDIVIVTIQNNLQALDILYESYGIIKKNDFINLINEYTQNHMVFVIRNDKLSNKPQIKYQWDKAISLKKKIIKNTKHS